MFLAEKNHFGEYSLSSTQWLHSPERELTLRLWSMYYNTPTPSWLGAHESCTFVFEQMVAQRVGPVTVTVIVLCAFACPCAVWPVSSCPCTANQACCTLIWQSRTCLFKTLFSYSLTHLLQSSFSFFRCLSLSRIRSSLPACSLFCSLFSYSLAHLFHSVFSSTFAKVGPLSLSHSL